MDVKYIEIDAHPKAEPEEWGFVLSKAISRLHGIFRSHEIRGGIDLPLATEVSTGSKLRVFGREPVLNAVVNNAGIQDFQKRRMIKLGPIQSVPEDAWKIRVRRVRKKGEAELLKRARRKRQFLLNKGVDPKEIKSVQALKAQGRSKERRPYFLIEKDNGKYSIFFKQDTAPEDAAWSEDGFNSYGLSSNERGVVFRF